jgi:hypothetical protein
VGKGFEGATHVRWSSVGWAQPLDGLEGRAVG